MTPCRIIRRAFALALTVCALATGCSLIPRTRAVPPGQEVAHAAPPLSRPEEVAPAAAPPATVEAIAAPEVPDGKEVCQEPEVARTRPSPPPAPAFPIIMNERIRASLKQIQTRRSVGIAQAFARARRYAGMMRGVFREQGLPEELINLAFIESHVNPRATSRANAAGIWQFVPATARRYGMRTGRPVDERRDPEKSTRAAAAYLRQLHARFESWPLALAAYNAGEATVQRAIARQATRDFWQLRLPRETRRFVPSFMAMTLIARDPERYGFSPPPDEPYDTEHLHIAEPTEIRVLAQAAGTSVKHLRELNPELVGTATPPTPSTYPLRIPRRVRWVSHTVRKGETLGEIAVRYSVSVSVLREMNNLGGGDVARPGAVLLVPLALSPPAS